MESYAKKTEDIEPENERKRDRSSLNDRFATPMNCATTGTNNATSAVQFMKLALEVAKSALNVGEVPVGCVIVLNRPYYYSSNSNEKDNVPENVIVSYGCNQVNATRDATRHAEMVRVKSFLHLFFFTDVSNYV